MSKKPTKKKYIKILRASGFTEYEIKRLVNVIKMYHGRLSYIDMIRLIIRVSNFTASFDECLYYIDTAMENHRMSTLPV